MDKRDILPGEQWELAINRAIKNSEFFLICLSARSVGKRGFLQREIRTALDQWQEMLDEDIYLIPVRFEEHDVPEALAQFQWVDLYETEGWSHLLRAIQEGMERRYGHSPQFVQRHAPAANDLEGEPSEGEHAGLLSLKRDLAWTQQQLTVLQARLQELRLKKYKYGSAMPAGELVELREAEEDEQRLKSEILRLEAQLRIETKSLIEDPKVQES